MLLQWETRSAGRWLRSFFAGFSPPSRKLPFFYLLDKGAELWPGIGVVIVPVRVNHGETTGIRALLSSRPQPEWVEDYAWVEGWRGGVLWVPLAFLRRLLPRDPPTPPPSAWRRSRQPACRRRRMAMCMCRRRFITRSWRPPHSATTPSPRRDGVRSRCSSATPTSSCGASASSSPSPPSSPPSPPKTTPLDPNFGEPRNSG